MQSLKIILMDDKPKKLGNPISIFPRKNCGKCGKEHKEIPATARVMDCGDPLDGFYWECDCGSTLFKKKGIEPMLTPAEVKIRDDLNAAVRMNALMTCKMCEEIDADVYRTLAQYHPDKAKKWKQEWARRRKDRDVFLAGYGLKISDQFNEATQELAPFAE